NQNILLNKEMHHRVKNNLQMVSSLLELQSEGINDSHALSALKTSQNRVHAVSMIHQKLYSKGQDMGDVNIKELSEDLSKYIADVYFNPKIDVKIDIAIPDQLKMDIDHTIPLSLIMNELLTNSFKYAFTKAISGEISIEISKTLDKYNFTYKDSGPGFDISQNSDSGSLGMRLIRILTNQLGTDGKWNNQRGVHYAISF
ncbi:MAG: sensor histidine kinase, partial [Flavobacteriales bacterium]|nr:sensor histidine kinase [Flavobacteriales bacterium]